MACITLMVHIIRDTRNMVNLVRMEKGSSVIPKSILIFSSPSREISEDYIALGTTSSFHVLSKSSTNHQPNIKLYTVGISSLDRAFRKITSNINQQMHLYNFHLKHFKAHKITPTCFDLFISSSGSFVVPC